MRADMALPPDNKAPNKVPDGPDKAFPEVPGEAATLELLGRIRDGQQDAWEDLYRRYHDDLLFAVRAHLGRRLRSALESEDVLQSVVIDAFKALPHFEQRHPGGLRAYLHKMVVNKIRDRADHFGAQKRAGTVPLTDSLAEHAAAPGEPTYLAGERFERLERCLGALPDDMARVLILRKVDGLSSRETAQTLGKSDDATRKLYSRALARLTMVMGASGG